MNSVIDTLTGQDVLHPRFYFLGTIATVFLVIFP